MQKINKKAQMGSLQTFVLAIAGVTIVLVVVMIVMAELRDTEYTNTAGCNSSHKTSCSAAYNSTQTMIGKVATIPTWVGILIVVAMAFLVMAYFTSRRSR